MRTINLQHPLVCASVCAGERYEYTSAQWNGRGGWRYLNDLHAFDLTTKVFMLNHTACMQCCIRHAEAFSIPLPISLLLSLLFLSFTLALSYSLADWPVCSHLRSLICTTGARARACRCGAMCRQPTLLGLTARRLRLGLAWPSLATDAVCLSCLVRTFKGLEAMRMFLISTGGCGVAWRPPDSSRAGRAKASRSITTPSTLSRQPRP